LRTARSTTLAFPRLGRVPAKKCVSPLQIIAHYVNARANNRFAGRHGGNDGEQMIFVSAVRNDVAARTAAYQRNPAGAILQT
jgi:hypothetical protein